jgi:predicted MPP superfamily phosphohydrolase
MLAWKTPHWLYRIVESLNTSGEVWLYCAAPAYLIFVIYRWLANRVPAETSPERRKLLQAAGTLAIASPFAAMAFGITVGRLDFHVREVDMPVAGLHPDLVGLRILQISDVHIGKFLSERQFARAIDMCQGLHPHLAFMTGDLITDFRDPVDACLRQLVRVKSDAGMFGCLGNHEIYTESEARIKRDAAKLGIDFLRSENRQLKFGAAVLNVAGVDYQKSSRKKLYLNGAEKLIVPGHANILLSHNPDVFPVAAAQGWDLTLAGHTHGGQVTLEIVEQTVNIARFVTPFVAGKYLIGKAGCYVTRGIGTIGLPARVGVPPEITLITLKKA